MAGKYRAYPEYKDSGIEWVEQLPEHWQQSKLRYMFSFGKGLTITKEDLLDDGVPCVNYGEVHSKYGFEVNPIIHPLKCVSDDYIKSSPRALLLKGDLVFADTSEDIEGSGNFTQLTSDETVFAGYHTIIARPNERKCSRFYAYLLDSVELRTQVRHAVKGVKVFSVTQAMLRGVNIWLPTLDERKKIANFLDHETAKIDALIDKQQQLIKLLKEKRQAVISHVVTKGLNPDVPMRDSGVEWLGKVPEHWSVLCIKRIVSIPVTDGPHETPNFIDSGIPFVSAEAISSGKVDFEKIRAHISIEDNARYSKKYSPKIHDIFMVKSGATTGVTAIVETDMEFNIWSPLAVIRCKQGVNPYFVLNFLRSINFQEAVKLNWSFGTQQNIGIGVIENLHVAVPPIDEAKMIVKYLTEKCSIYDGIIDKTNQQIELSKERRTALISAAVTGKIDVRNWQTPASPLN